MMSDGLRFLIFTLMLIFSFASILIWVNWTIRIISKSIEETEKFLNKKDHR